MGDISILHNPRCSKSRAAVTQAREAGVEVRVVEYLTKPLTRDDLLDLLGRLEDPPSALVRRDPLFKELGLTDAQLGSPAKVADLLAEHPRLMERPVLDDGVRAIIGRPTERAVEFLGGGAG